MLVWSQSKCSKIMHKTWTKISILLATFVLVGAGCTASAQTRNANEEMVNTRPVQLFPISNQRKNKVVKVKKLFGVQTIQAKTLPQGASPGIPDRFPVVYTGHHHGNIHEQHGHVPHLHDHKNNAYTHTHTYHYPSHPVHIKTDTSWYNRPVAQTDPFIFAPVPDLQDGRNYIRANGKLGVVGQVRLTFIQGKYGRPIANHAVDCSSCIDVYKLQNGKVIYPKTNAQGSVILNLTDQWGTAWSQDANIFRHQPTNIVVGNNLYIHPYAHATDQTR